MTCWVCNPVCENCKPKFVECPECGDRCFLNEPRCRRCGHVFSAEEQEGARALWRESHPRPAERP